MALKLASSRVSTGRAAALRDVLGSSELLAKEASLVLDDYGGHLNELIESVELVADRAQVRPWLFTKNLYVCDDPPTAFTLVADF